MVPKEASLVGASSSVTTGKLVYGADPGLLPRPIRRWTWIRTFRGEHSTGLARAEFIAGDARRWFQILLLVVPVASQRGVR